MKSDRAWQTRRLVGRPSSGAFVPRSGTYARALLGCLRGIREAARAQAEGGRHVVGDGTKVKTSGARLPAR